MSVSHMGFHICVFLSVGYMVSFWLFCAFVWVVVVGGGAFCRVCVSVWLGFLFVCFVRVFLCFGFVFDFVCGSL